MTTDLRRVVDTLRQQSHQILFVDPGMPGSHDGRERLERRDHRAIPEQAVNGFVRQAHGALTRGVAVLELDGTKVRMKIMKPGVDRR